VDEEKKYSVDEDKLKRAIEADKEGAVSIHDDLARAREDYYKQYKCEPYGNERDGWSQSIAPVIWNFVQGILPSMMEVFHQDFFTLSSQDDERAEKYKELIKYQLFRKQDGFRKLFDFFYNAFLFHFGVFKIYNKEDFTLEHETIPYMTEQEFVALAEEPNAQITLYTEEEGEELGEKTYADVKVVRRKVTYHGPYVESVPPSEFYFSKDCYIGDWGEIKGKLVYHKVRRTLDYVRRNERAKVYKEGSYAKLKEKYAKPLPEEEVTRRFDTEDIAEPSDNWTEDNVLLKEVDIEEHYYLWDLDGDGLLEPCIVSICDDVVLRTELNPYGRPPFRVGIANPEPNKITGMAYPSILAQNQKIQTNLIRLIQDGAAQACYRNPITTDPQLYRQLIDRKPHATILGDPGRVGEVKVSDPSQFVLKAYELIKAENEEMTSITRYNQGLDADSLNKTATGSSIINQNSMRRLRMMARLFGNGPITGLIRDFIFINRKFPNGDAVKLFGAEIEFDPGDMQGEYDIEIDIGAGPGEKQMVVNQLDLYVQFATQYAVPRGILSDAHVVRAMRKKFKLLDINIHGLIPTEDEMKRVEAQKEQQMRIMQMIQMQRQKQGNALPGVPPQIPQMPPPA